MSQTKAILRKATRDNTKPLNILTYATHESVDSNFAQTGHNIYAIRRNDLKDWDNRYRPVPNNYILLDKDLGEHGIPGWVDFDLVLSQNKFAHFDLSKQIASQLNIPLLNLEHCLPEQPITPQQQEWIRQRFECSGNIFISSYSQEAWGYDDSNSYVVRHMCNENLFSPNPFLRQQPYILSVANQFRERNHLLNFDGWARCVNGLPVRLVGDNPGLSQAARSVEELVQEYQRATIFFNSSTVSPLPSSLVDAMMAGLACVSTATCMIVDVIEHGVTGFISNDEKELRGYLELLLEDNDLATEMGRAARESAKALFSKERYVKEWNTILYNACR